MPLMFIGFRMNLNSIDPIFANKLCVILEDRLDKILTA